MDPLRAAQLRRNWPVVGAIAALLVVSLMHLVGFGPVLNRYQRVAREGAKLGMSLDPQDVSTMLPPRLFALLADNTLPDAAVAEQSNSGALTAELIGDLNRRAAVHGLDVVMSEPGPVSQQNRYVLVSAHLRLRGPYGGLVGLLDNLANSGRLLAVERFSIAPTETGEAMIELYVTRCVMKRAGGPG